MVYTAFLKNNDDQKKREGIVKHMHWLGSFEHSCSAMVFNIFFFFIVRPEVWILTAGRMKPGMWIVYIQSFSGWLSGSQSRHCCLNLSSQFLRFVKASTTAVFDGVNNGRLKSWQRSQELGCKVLQDTFKVSTRHFYKTLSKCLVVVEGNVILQQTNQHNQQTKQTGRCCLMTV